MKKNTNRLAMAATFAGLLAVAPVARGADMSMSKMSSGDAKFMKEAAMGGMEEVDLGKLAAQKAASPDVKSFAQKMVDDHSKANDQLMQLASQKGVTLPTGMSSDEKSATAKLDKLSGADFDKAYVSMMVKDHKKDVAEFEKASKNAKDSDLKSWASTTLPTLQDHLKMIQGISATMPSGMMKH
jgi:putative membrane protein